MDFLYNSIEKIVIVFTKEILKDILVKYIILYI